MFLQELTPPQQKAFLSLAVRLVATDGQVGEAELELLSQMALQVGVTPGWRPDSDSPLPALLGAFDSPRSRAAALLELLGLAHADTHYGSQERAFIAQVAAGLSVPPERLAVLEGWVIRQLSLSAEAAALLEGP